MNKHYADTIINFSYTLNNKTQVANVVVNYNFESLTQKNKDFLLKQLNNATNLTNYLSLIHI